MWVSKVSELIGSSPEGFEDAARVVVERACKTLRGITGFQVLDKRVKVDCNQIVEYRVRLSLEFDMAPESAFHR